MRINDAALGSLEPDFNSLSEKLLDNAFESLPERERVVLAVMNFIPTFENGAFYTWFWNSTGDWAYHTEEALRRIGATRSAATLQQAIDVFPSRETVLNRDSRMQYLEESSVSQQEELLKLSDELDSNGEDLYELLADYWFGEARPANG